MEQIEFRWLQGTGQPPRGSIIVSGGHGPVIWQVLQSRCVERMQPTDYGEIKIWGDWENVPVALQP
jgi:hypothetical protein